MYRWIKLKVLYPCLLVIKIDGISREIIGSRSLFSGPIKLYVVDIL